MRYAFSAVLVAGLLASADGARADDAGEETRSERESFVRKLAKRAIVRGRRSLSLGPTIGLGAGAGVDSGNADAQLSVGVGLLRYDIPFLPSSARLRDIVESRFRTELTRRLAAAIIGGGQLTDADKKRIAREVWADIKGELLLENRPQRWEKPSFAIRAEVTRLFDGEAWDLRLMFGIGIGPVFLSAGPSARWADGAALVIPVELSKPMLLSDSLRSPVVDFFLRGEFAATERDEREDVILLGARFVLDII